MREPGTAPNLKEKLSWTQPMCDWCWEHEHPYRQPRALIAESRFQEICCMCGDQTQSGIYVGRDPDRVPFPAVVVEWDGE